MSLAAIAFWGAIALLVYMFAGFPLLILLRGLLFERPVRSADITPSISMIIAAHNEGGVIEAKLENTLALDYPAGQLEVIVAADGCTDTTHEIVERYAARGVRLLTLPRGGKIPALNAGAAAATGDILVFTDANSMFAPNALRALARPFADPQVGGVAGSQRYQPARQAGVSSGGEKLYWNFDELLKAYQSRAGSVTSATGAIYALRRSLYQPIPTTVGDDFTISTGVVEQGYRLVFATDAVSYEPVEAKSAVEFGRKLRIISQGLRGIWLRRALLNPLQHGFYALQLFSHKLLRRLMFLPLLVLLVASPLLWNEGLLYRVAALTQAAFYAAALLGLALERAPSVRLHLPRPVVKILSIPYFFCVVYVASLIATWNTLRGHRVDRWESRRAGVSARET